MGSEMCIRDSPYLDKAFVDQGVRCSVASAEDTVVGYCLGSCVVQVVACFGEVATVACTAVVFGMRAATGVLGVAVEIGSFPGVVVVAAAAETVGLVGDMTRYRIRAVHAETPVRYPAPPGGCSRTLSGSAAVVVAAAPAAPVAGTVVSSLSVVG